MSARHPHRETWSYSKLRWYERCPRAYKLRYLERQDAAPSEAMAFGTAMHVVLELLIKEHVEDGVTGRLNIAAATDLWTEAWRESGLKGLSRFAEGMAMLRSFVARQGTLDPSTILAVELPFEIDVGGSAIVGVLERVDMLDLHTIDVLDYKTGPAASESNALELGLYHLAARKLWPWARTIRTGFEMMRRGVRVRPTFEHDLDAVTQYILLLGETMEADEVFEARLGRDCAHCPFRMRCSAYLETLWSRRFEPPQRFTGHWLTDAQTNAEHEGRAQARLSVGRSVSQQRSVPVGGAWEVT